MMKRVVFCAAAMSAVCAFGEVNDGLLWSMRYDEGQANGSFDQTKYADELTVSSPAGRRSFEFKYPEGHAPYVSNMTVKAALEHRTLANEPCLYVDQPTNWVSVGDGPATSFVFYPQYAKVPSDLVPTSNATIYARIKWPGRVGPANQTYKHDYSIIFYKNDCFWGNNVADSRGWSFYLGSYGGMAGNAWLGVQVGQKSLLASDVNKLGPNAELVAGKFKGSYVDLYASYDWVDVAATLEYVPADGRTYVSIYKSVPSDNGQGIGLVRAYGFVEHPIHNVRTANAVLFGSSDKVITNGSANAVSHFRGAVQSMKLWNRALSPEEIGEVMAGAAQTWKVGKRNGSSEEFSDENAAAEFDPLTMRWSKMRRTLNAENPSVVFKWTMLTNTVPLSRVLHAKTLGAAQGERFEVWLNGAKVGSPAVRDDGELWLFLPERVWSGRLGNDRVATLTLKRVSAVGEVSLDYVELSGSWQLGAANADVADTGFWNNANSADYWLSAANRYARNYMYQNSTMSYHFALPKEMAERYGYVLEVGTMFSNTNRMPLAFAVNGVALTPSLKVSGSVSKWTMPVPEGALAEENVFTVTTGKDSQGSTASYAFDFLRLDCVNTHPQGTAAIVR